MAGHSKWANIQHRKGRQDAARSKLFSKLAKEITVAAKMGDPDPDKNPRLRLAVKEAKSQSVPKDVIDRAIKKSQGGDAESYDEIRSFSTRVLALLAFASSLTAFLAFANGVDFGGSFVWGSVVLLSPVTIPVTPVLVGCAVSDMVGIFAYIYMYTSRYVHMYQAGQAGQAG